MTQDELIGKARQGDDDAFYLSMSEHKAQLYRIAYAYLKNEHDALEAIQETTFRAYQNIRQVKSPAHFKTWLIRILINYCIDTQKKSRKYQPAHEQSQQANDITTINETKIEIEEALTQLDHRYRQIILLKYYEDLTIGDIALTLHRPEGTIKTWLHQALKQLRTILAEEGEEHA